MSDQTINLPIGTSWGRRVLLLVVPAVLALGGVWFAARWCLANTIAEWVPDGAAARAAARIAPDDPQTHFTLAELGARTLEPAELPEAVRQYELATSLSPHDYRLWMKLGQARGQVGDVAGAEDALRRAVVLAPKYPDPHWFLGNQLLRQGRSDEAFVELRQAGDANPARFRPQVFDLAWRVYRADVPSVLNAVGTSASARAQLTEYLLNQKRADDALRLWAGLDAAQKHEQAATGDKLLRALYDAKRYRDALDVQRDLAAANGAAATTTSATPAIGALLNGGFEAAVGAPGRSYFDWQVTPLAGVQIGLDERVRHGGTRSLRLVFNAPDSFAFSNVSQFVVVEPHLRYRLTCFVRIDDLKSASTLTTEIIDPATGRVLAVSAPLSTGTADWQMIALDFNPEARTEAITVRLTRPPCSAATCPMFGKVWYDDFTLQPLGVAAGSVDRSASISRSDGRPSARAR